MTQDNGLPDFLNLPKHEWVSGLISCHTKEWSKQTIIFLKEKKDLVHVETYSLFLPSIRMNEWI